MGIIIDKVNEAVSTRNEIAMQIGISHADIQLMEHAFRKL
jgi:hypothetical protein